MPRRIQSSRNRFVDYCQRVLQRPGQRLPASQGSDSGRHGRRGKSRSSRQLIGEFLSLLGDQTGSVVFALCTVACATLLGLLPPAATKFLVDYVLGDQILPQNWLTRRLPTDHWQLLLWTCLGVAGISLLRVLVQMTGRWVATRSTKRLQFQVRKRVFEHAVRLPLHRVFELKTGGVSGILREDAGAVGELIFGMLYNPFRAVIQLVGSLCILAWVDWRLLAGGLFLVPIVYLTHRTWIHRIRPRYRDVRASREEIDGMAAEAFGGMRVVRAFSRQRSETLRFVRSNHYMGRQELFVWWWTRGIEIVWETLIPISSAGLMLYGGWQVLQGTLTLGDLMMFLAYLLFLLEPLAVLATSAAQFQNSLSALDRVLDLLGEPREMTLQAGPKRMVDKSAVRGVIEFQNVTFEYPGTEQSALEDISFTAQPGRSIALVGPSGSGKTTLCNLVARFFDPSAGRVLLDGVDLREFDVESYRHLLGVVDQDVFLFDGTIWENIAFGNRSAEDSAVVQAARIANADDFIRRLPDGYDTVIGERGVKLSGGQRQRIAIARAVLADPKILILDEATSNLDTESERLIQESLTALMAGRTSFVVAHRLSTIQNADTILVLEQGRLRESGSHSKLMQTDGRYREMVLLQTSTPDILSSPAVDIDEDIEDYRVDNASVSGS